MVYNYENQTYRFSGGSVINDLEGTKQVGLLLYFRHKDPNNLVQELTIFVDKRDCAHIAKLTKAGRKYWKPFRLPKMVKQ